MGESLSTLLKLPLWGWGDEKIGFVSTMDLPTIDECMRYEALNMLDGRTPEQDAELEAIRRSEVGWIFRYSSTDETYQAYRRELLKARSEEHASELQSLMRISYAVFCLKKTKHTHTQQQKIQK